MDVLREKRKEKGKERRKKEEGTEREKEKPEKTPQKGKPSRLQFQLAGCCFFEPGDAGIALKKVAVRRFVIEQGPIGQ